MLVPVHHEQLHRGAPGPAQLLPSSLDVLVLVGEVGVQAGLYSNDTLLLKDMWRAWTPELAGLFGTW